MHIDDPKLVRVFLELGVELRRGASLAELTSLGEVWETATASLAAQHGPLTVSAADRLLALPA